MKSMENADHKINHFKSTPPTSHVVDNHLASHISSQSCWRYSNGMVPIFSSRMRLNWAKAGLLVHIETALLRDCMMEW